MNIAVLPAPGVFRPWWWRFVFGCLVLVVSTGCESAKDYSTKAAAHAAVTLAKHTALSAPAPRPAPDDSEERECDNCNGTGKIGDGTVMVDCPVCGGDGVVDSSDSAVRSSSSSSDSASSGYAKVTILTLPGCSPCDKWKANEAQDLQEHGWLVTQMRLESGAAPQFRVCIGESCYTHRGYLTHEDLWAILRRHRSAEVTSRHPTDIVTPVSDPVQWQRTKPIRSWNGFRSLSWQSCRTCQ